MPLQDLQDRTLYQGRFKSFVIVIKGTGSGFMTCALGSQIVIKVPGVISCRSRLVSASATKDRWHRRGTASEHMMAVFLFAPYIISFCSALLTAPTANGAMLKQQ